MYIPVIPTTDRGRAAAAAAFRSAGAISPSQARPRAELTSGIDPRRWDALLAEGAIREGAPGTYYWFELPPRTRPRVLLMVIVIAHLLVVAAVVFLAR